MSDPTIQITPREMVEAMRQNPRPSTFLRDLFVRREQYSNKTIIEIDKVNGSQIIANFVARSGGPNVVGKAGYETLLHAAPYLYEKIPYGPDDLDVRGAGMTVYDDPSAALNERVAEWLMDLDDRFTRNEEKQIADAILTGEISVSGKGVNYTVDFDQKAAHILDE